MHRAPRLPRLPLARTRPSPLALFSLSLGALASAACGGGGGGGGGSGQNPPTGPTPVDSDLVAVSIAVTEATIEAGLGVNVALIARNLGPQAAPAFRMGVYLSTDDLFDAADPRLGYWSVGGLPVNADTAAGGSLTVPLTTLAATYHVLLAVDDVNALGEPDETNNVAVAPTTLVVQPPVLADLVPVALSFQPFTVDAGTTFEVADTVENVALGAAGSFRVGVYLSTDDTITTADVLIGHRSVLSLNPGALDAAVGDLTVPATLAPGNYHVGVIVDDQATVPEVDEGDNIAVAGVLLEVRPAPQTDLVATAVSFTPASVDVGTPLDVDEAVRNDGLIAAGAFQVGVYLSQDVDIDPAVDVLLGFRTLPSLAAGATSASGSVGLTVPTTVTAGLWFVGVVADHTHLVPDSNRANNTRVALQQVQIDVPPLPDLVATELTFSPTSVAPGVGGVIQVDDLVRNVGPVPSGAFRVGVYLSDNSVISPSDVLLGSRTLTSLANGGASGAGSSFPLPPGLSTGSYYVGLVVDDLEEQTELSEGNNLLLASGVLDVTSAPTPMPNLVMEVVDPGSSQSQPGFVVQVVSRVKNTGTASASGNFRVGFYLSTDETITTDDLFLGDRLVPFGLGIGFTSVASVPVTIPSTVAGGTYRFGALADWTQAITESDESDNGLAMTGNYTIVIPQPNLRVTALTVPTATPLTSGASLDVDHTVRNAGNLAAGAFRVGIYLSSDNTLDRALDTLIGSRTIGVLAAGTLDEEVTAVTIPAGLTPGAYHVGVYVDDLEQVGEQDEADNTRVMVATVTVQ